MSPSDRWLTSDQAAATLEVRRSTLYSYVSRGLVMRGFARDGAGHRVSTFDRSEVVALAAARTRPRAGASQAPIESDASALDAGGTWMAILAGQCAMSGPAQAGASRHTAGSLRRWLDGIPPRPDEPLPGFGHRVYTGDDPRCDLLLAEVARLDAGLVADAERLCVEAARTRGAYPNVDLALAALILAADLDPDCGEVIFTLARAIGLAAHAMEEYPHGLRPRAMASQTGLG